MWTFQLVFKLSESAICEKEAIDLYWHIFEITYSSTASTDCWFQRFTLHKVTSTIHSPTGTNMFGRRESEHTPERKQRDKGQILIFL